MKNIRKTATAKWLRDLLKETHQCVAALAQLACVSRASVYNALSGGNNIGIETSERLAKAFDLKLPSSVRAEAGKRQMRQVHSEKDGKQDPTYTVFMNMHDRCYNQKSKAYKHYGGTHPPVCVSSVGENRGRI
jgi:DNA-binding phage protein